MWHENVERREMVSDDGGRLTSPAFGPDWQFSFVYERDDRSMKLMGSQLVADSEGPTDTFTVYLTHGLSSHSRHVSGVELGTAEIDQVKSDLAVALPQWRQCSLDVPIRHVVFK